MTDNNILTDPRFYPNYPKLNELCLGRKQLDDEYIIHIVEFLNRHPEISRLDLSGNRITDFGAKQLSQLINILENKLLQAVHHY